MNTIIIAVISVAVMGMVCSALLAIGVVLAFISIKRFNSKLNQ